MEFFDYMKCFFSRDEKKWNGVSVKEKRTHFWRMNRMMSIKMPVQTAMISRLKVNLENVSDHWHRAMTAKYTDIPFWVYTKTIKKNEDLKKKNKISNEMKRWYCENNEISMREFDEKISYFGEKFVKEIEKLEKTMRSQGFFKNDAEEE